MAQLRIKDLKHPVTAAKADWLAGTTWIGFTPTSGDLQSRNDCTKTIQRQFGDGYVIEYITEQISEPNTGFENSSEYISEKIAHKTQAGRFIAVHKLRYSSKKLSEILGQEEYNKTQDMWAQGTKRWRWSVAFPIIESFRIIGSPKAKDVLGEEAYRRLFAHSSATLRTLNESERLAIANLEIERISAPNAYLAIEHEFDHAALSDIPPETQRLIDDDLSTNALEGMTEERKKKIRIRAGWLADKFIRERQRSNSLICDDCGFLPAERIGSLNIHPRSLLDVHHKHPLEEGARYTSTDDYALLCPTCHRVVHAIMSVEK